MLCQILYRKGLAMVTYRSMMTSAMKTPVMQQFSKDFSQPGAGFTCEYWQLGYYFFVD